MKRIMTLILAVTAVASSNLSLAQANTQGSVIIDPYYGFPNFGASFSKNFETSGNSDLKVKGLGPLGLRAEYMLADKIGVGVDVIFNNYDLTYKSTDSLYNGATDTYTTTVNENEYKMNRLRIQARFNYHFEVNNPNLDAYLGIGAGSNNRFRKAYENGVEVTDDADLGNLTLLPVSFRFCTGLRYYFTENIGMNAEIGLGGPLISAGLSLRF